jgi:hypothetical protein
MPMLQLSSALTLERLSTIFLPTKTTLSQGVFQRKEGPPARGRRQRPSPAVPFPWPFSSRAQRSPPSSSLAWRCDPAAGDGLLAGDRRVSRRGGAGRRQPRALQARARPAQGVPFLSRPAHYFRVSKADPSLAQLPSSSCRPRQGCQYSTKWAGSARRAFWFLR